MNTNNVIAVLCSDIHLSHKPPVARSVEPDWYEAMQRPLRQLSEIALKEGAVIVCAGDVFDHWNCPPELINFAIDCLPKMYAIPGQHDMPHHNPREMDKSAYKVLQKQGTLQDAYSTIRPGLCLFPFPWGTEIKCLETIGIKAKRLAVVHKYIWFKEHKYPRVQQEDNAASDSLRKRLQGYDAAVFGDNHKGFVVGKICNCGSLLPRSWDQRNYKPFVGLLHEDATITHHFLDISQDKWIEPEGEHELVEKALNIVEFVDELCTLESKVLDLREAINRFLSTNTIDPNVRKIVLEAIE